MEYTPYIYLIDVKSGNSDYYLIIQRHASAIYLKLYLITAS